MNVSISIDLQIIVLGLSIRICGTGMLKMEQMLEVYFKMNQGSK